MHAIARTGDRLIYRSNLTCPDLTGNFKHAVCRVMPHSLGHTVSADADFDPNCCSLTHDEAAILYHCGLRTVGDWVVIGARLGWCSAHLAEAGCSVNAIEPELARMSFADRFRENTEKCQWNRIVTQAMTSAEFFQGQYREEIYGGSLIDGNHDAPWPRYDAECCAGMAKPDACIVFHDLLGSPIQDAVVWLLDNGWSARVYYTPHMMAVAYRGAFNPPDHVRDPDIDWAFVARNMPTFPFERCS